MIEQLARLPIDILRRVARQFTGGQPVRQTLRGMLSGETSAEEPAFDPRPPVPAPAPVPESADPTPDTRHLAPTPPPDTRHPAPLSLDITPLPTPNPNAMKFVVGVPVVDSGSISFTSAEAAKGNPLGEALFAIDGVRIVFGVNDFVSVTKNNDVSWFDLIPAVEGALREHVGAAAA